MIIDRIPDEINLILRKERVLYNQRMENYVSTRCKKREIKEYLGTYWPRSFTELRNITLDFISQPLILNNLKSKKEIKILDIGSGTGGNVFGFLWAILKDEKIFSDIKNITVDAIDNCKLALKYQKIFLKKIFRNFKIILRRHLIEINSTDDIKNKIQKKLENEKYDFIMCCKFVNEFYRKDFSTYKGMYNVIVSEIFEKFLEDYGLAILMDMTDRLENNDYLPKIMNNEIINYIKRSKLKIIIPLSCAFYYDKCINPASCYNKKTFRVTLPERTDFSNVNYKIFVKEEYAKKILDQIKRCINYYVSEANSVQICKEGVCINAEKLLSNEIYDAFSFREILEKDSYDGRVIIDEM